MKIEDAEVGQKRLEGGGYEGFGGGVDSCCPSVLIGLVGL